MLLLEIPACKISCSISIIDKVYFSSVENKFLCFEYCPEHICHWYLNLFLKPISQCVHSALTYEKRDKWLPLIVLWCCHLQGAACKSCAIPKEEMYPLYLLSHIVYSKKKKKRQLCRDPPALRKEDVAGCNWITVVGSVLKLH